MIVGVSLWMRIYYDSDTFQNVQPTNVPLKYVNAAIIPIEAPPVSIIIKMGSTSPIMTLYATSTITEKTGITQNIMIKVST